MADTTSIQDVLDRYFPDRQPLYFQSSDALSSVEGDTYLRYSKAGVIQLWFGGSSGEVCILCTYDGDKLEQVIKALTS